MHKRNGSTSDSQNNWTKKHQRGRWFYRNNDGSFSNQVGLHGDHHDDDEKLQVIAPTPTRRNEHGDGMENSVWPLMGSSKHLAAAKTEHSYSDSVDVKLHCERCPPGAANTLKQWACWTSWVKCLNFYAADESRGKKQLLLLPLC